MRQGNFGLGSVRKFGWAMLTRKHKPLTINNLNPGKIHPFIFLEKIFASFKVILAQARLPK